MKDKPNLDTLDAMHEIRAKNLEDMMSDQIAYVLGIVQETIREALYRLHFGEVR